MRNTRIFHIRLPRPLRIIGDIFAYTSKRIDSTPSVSPAIICMRRALEPELAYTLADGMEYLRTGFWTNFVPMDPISQGSGYHHLMEVAEMRAGRLAGASIVQRSGSSSQSMALADALWQTRAGNTEQDPYNNTAGPGFEATAGCPGGRTSCIPIPLGSDRFADRLFGPDRRDTQLFIQKKTGILPGRGSPVVPAIMWNPQQLVERALVHIREVEELGRMTRPWAGGAQDADRTGSGPETGPDRWGQDHIIGANLFRSDETPDFPDLEVNPGNVRRKHRSTD